MHILKFFTHSLIFILLPFALMAQSNGLDFNTIDRQTGKVTAETSTGEIHERLYYSLNKNLFEEGSLHVGDNLRIETEPGKISQLQVSRISEYLPGTLSVIAKSLSDGTYFSFTYADGRLNGLYHNHDHTNLYFEHDKASGKNYITDRSSLGEDELSCGVEGHHAEIMPPSPGVFQKSGASIHHPYQPPNIRSMDELGLFDEVTIDLMIVYTEKAEQWANQSDSGSIEEVIAQSMNLSQLGLDNSEAGIKLRLVHVHKTDYDEDGEDSPVSGEVHLRRLSQNPTGRINFNTGDDEIDGFMNEVHDLRNEFGADLVALYPKISDTGGIAWVNNSTAGNPAIGFSVNRVQQVGRTFTLIHEIGHNFGSVHSRTQEEAAAGSLGGLFKYSTGFQIGSGESQFNTIMAYNESGARGNNLPFFSSPDILTADGIPAGSERSDNVLGFNQVKRVISAYRPTMVEPPAISVSPNGPIDVTLTDDQSTYSVPITISNNGLTDLSWNIDFDMTSTSFDFRNKEQDLVDPVHLKTIEPVSITEADIPMAAHTPSLTGKAKGGESLIYQTGFENSEGFIYRGSVDTLAGWRVQRLDMQFSIISENPSSGNQHLRVSSTSGTDQSIVVRPPFFGVQPVGDYEFSADISINPGSDNNNQEVFDLYLLDTTPEGTTDTDRISAGIILSDGRLFVYGESQDQQSFFGTDFRPENNQYFNLRIVFDASSSFIHYYVNDDRVRSLRYTGPNTPDYAWILNRNESSDGHFDVDNVKLVRNADPFRWMDVARYTGVSAVNESEDLTLSFTAEGVPNGLYSTEMILNSNDPDAGSIRVPINVRVDLDDPIGGTIPDQVTLSQNFPNPFNPVTTIRYAIDEPQQVRLEVYNITGSLVATLVDQQQAPGTYQVNFNGSGLSSGVYIYRLQTPTRVLNRKMVLVK